MPNGLNAALINGWLTDSIKSADPDRLYYVLKRWKSLPDRPSETVPVDQALFLAHRERTDVAATNLLKHAPNVPKGLNTATINGWLSGKIKTARKDHLDFVLKQWVALDSVSHIYVDLTTEMIEQLSFFRDEGLLPGPVFKDAANVPDDLNVYMVSGWLSGKAKKARKDHIDFVYSQCARLANDDTRRIPITDEMHAALEQCQARSSLSQSALLKSLDTIPEGLTAATITSWIGRTTATARKDHYDFVIKAWSKE